LIERITPDNQRGVMYLLGWRYPPYRSYGYPYYNRYGCYTPEY
jgi:hypothetical protein